jgi:ankyrin repeat protein
MTTLSNLQKACKNGDYEEVSKCIFVDKENVDGEISYSPIYIACEKGHMDIAKLLLTCGANVNKTYGRKKTTALHGACLNGSKTAVKNLINIIGIDINAKDRYGDSPIHDYIGFRNDITGEIYNLITSHRDFDWNCTDVRGLSFYDVVGEAMYINEKYEKDEKLFEKLEGYE